MWTDLFDKLKELFQKDKPVTVDVDGKPYAVKPDGTLGDYVRPPLPIAPVAKPVLPLLTLSGFVAAFTSGLDEFPIEVAVQVVSPTVVTLVSLRADEWGRRHTWLRAEAANENPFKFGNYMEVEAFLINLQAGFLPSDNTHALSVMCSNVTAGNSVAVADDGVSQVVTMQEGAMTRGSITVPNRLPLAPYRTFREITPVESDFLLRMKPVKDALPTVALLEVDGGKWKLDTVMAVAEWLQEKLPAATVIA